MSFGRQASCPVLFYLSSYPIRLPHLFISAVSALFVSVMGLHTFVQFARLASLLCAPCFKHGACPN